MPKAIPDGFSSVTAVLTFKDTKRAIAFYQKAFGAKQEFISELPNGKGVSHAVIRIGDTALMLGDEQPGAPGKSAETLGNASVSFYIYVPDVDAAYKQAVDAGAVSTMPLADMFWGDRMGAVKDLFGYSWTLATHVKDVSEKELEAAVKKHYAPESN